MNLTFVFSGSILCCIEFDDVDIQLLLITLFTILQIIQELVHIDNQERQHFVQNLICDM